MKVYQCIRAYDPYIEIFEKRYKVKENNFSFAELRDLIIKDGFASTYILKPGFGDNKDFFYTLWNYKTLQYKWAEENGLKTTELDQIRIAQIEEFKPDVYYNFSPRHDTKNLNKIFGLKNLVTVCWDAIAVALPPLHENYNLRATLFDPFLTYWEQYGYDSFFLPPAFPESWNNLNKDKKDIDILFYGQYNENFFSSRNKILTELIKWSKQHGYNFELHLQFADIKRPLINIRGIKKLTRWLPVAPPTILNNSLPPVYGQQLYETIARSKLVINAFGDYNGIYRNNMRDYESIGCEAFLISEDGVYPPYFIPGKDFLTYKSTSELFSQIEKVLENYEEEYLPVTQKANIKLKEKYSKEKQWDIFSKKLSSL